MNTAVFLRVEEGFLTSSQDFSCGGAGGKWAPVLSNNAYIKPGDIFVNSSVMYEFPESSLSIVSSLSNDDISLFLFRATYLMLKMFSFPSLF